MHSRSAIVLVSGGLDSFVTAALAREAGFGVFALTVDYNQRHRIELDAAARVAAAIGADRHVTLSVNLSAFGGSALTAHTQSSFPHRTRAGRAGSGRARW